MAFNRFSILTRGFAKAASLDWTDSTYRILLITVGYLSRVVAAVVSKFSLRGYGVSPSPMPRYRRRQRLPYAAMKVWEREKKMEQPLSIRKIRDYVIVKRIRS